MADTEKESKSKEKEDKKAKKTPQKISEVALDADIDGFLIPEYFRRKSKFRNHPLFRMTSLLMVATVIAAGILTIEYLAATKNIKITQKVQDMQMEESQRLQATSATFKPVKAKYRELDVLRRQMRVPLSPVLDAMEKTIPESISINKLTSGCIPSINSTESKRKEIIKAEVYFPPDVKADDPAILSWTDAITAKLADWSLKLSKSEWGPIKHYDPNMDQIKRLKPDQAGNIRELTLTVELPFGEK
jgi:Tfp pilus assembly protein PilN